MSRRKRRTRISMRKMREVLRLGLSENLGCREIARSCAIAPSTVVDYLRRARECNLGEERWEEMDDATLEGRLFPTRDDAQKRPSPDCPRCIRSCAARA